MNRSDSAPLFFDSDRLMLQGFGQGEAEEFSPFLQDEEFGESQNLPIGGIVGEAKEFLSEGLRLFEDQTLDGGFSRVCRGGHGNSFSKRARFPGYNLIAQFAPEIVATPDFPGVRH